MQLNGAGGPILSEFVAHALEVAEKVRGRPLPDGRGSVSGCKHDAPILSHDRKGVGCRLFQQPLKRAPQEACAT